MDVPLAMEEWYQEHAYYNLSAATCAQGQVCGHYTQVVWAKTERIGCGTHFCEKLEGVKETNIQILVCNYEPPGNVKGKRPYQEGTPCSQCPSGYRCENKLCEPIRGPEEAQDLPDLQSTSNLATEALGTGKSGAPSLAKESPSSPATGGTGLLATKALPAAETRAPSSLVTTEPFSMATEAMSSSLNEGPSTLATPRLPPLEEEPDTLQQMTQTPSPKPMDTVASETSIPSLSPQTTLSPKIPLPGTGGPSLSPGKTLSSKISTTGTSGPSLSLERTLSPKTFPTGTSGPSPSPERTLSPKISTTGTSEPSLSLERTLSPKTFPIGTGGPSPNPERTLSPQISTTGTGGPSPNPERTLSPQISTTGTGGPSLNPERTLSPKTFPTGTSEPLPQAQWPPSSEILASDFPVQNQPGELQAILDHMGHTSSKSLSSIPNASAIANATGGRTLALQASLPGASEKHSMKWRMNGGHMGGPLQGLVLLPLLVLAAMF
ncbi:peptidase inhibitor 16 isoform X2 [Ochotona curzoniae]|nr:peptidase inhibitor 16 isoform X2 [Ochotona curzoniae]